MKRQPLVLVRGYHIAIGYIHGMASVGDEMAEEQNVQITHMMIGNPSKPSIANVFFGQQILFGQVILRAIGSHPFFIAPVARQGKPMKPINTIALCCLQFGNGKVAMIEMGKLISSQGTFEMTSHLLWAKVGAIGKDREQMSLSSIGRFWLATGQGTKMAGKASHVINACEHIQEVSFRNLFDKGLLQLCEHHRCRFCS